MGVMCMYGLLSDSINQLFLLRITGEKEAVLSACVSVCALCVCVCVCACACACECVYVLYSVVPVPH